jgi:hypothetical protein
MKTYKANSPEFLVAYAETLKQCDMDASKANAMWEKYDEINDCWCLHTSDICLPKLVYHHESVFRLKPKTITINGTELPAPISKKPDHRQVFYVIQADKVSEHYWVGSEFQEKSLKNGKAYANKEDAELVNEFLIKLFTQA